MNWLFTPPWSERWIAVVALGLLALAGARRWREGRGGGPLALRTLVIGGLLVVMLNPQAPLARERAGKPRLVVLLDTSASMAARDAGGDSRLGAALKVLTNASTRAGLNRDFVLDTRQFDRDVRPADLSRLSGENPGGDATDIGQAVMRVVSDLASQTAQAGVLLVSDGQATTAGADDAAQLALARSVPLWTWTLGGPVPKRDLWIETASAEALAFSGAEVQLTATLRQTGYPNRSFKVDLLKDDKVIATKEVTPDAGGAARVTLSVTAPEEGEQRYVFRVPPEPEQADTSRNERAVFVRSVGRQVRVLVAEGEPSWDTKFLVQSLKRNPKVDLTAVYRLNAQRRVAVLSATNGEMRSEQDLFPRTAEAMNAYDVIVLGRQVDAFFDNNTEALLTDFVGRRGGSLVFARGKAYGGRFPALAKFEPVAWGGGADAAVKLRPTEAGREHPIFDLGAAGTLEELLDRLPALDQAGATLGEKPLAVVLAGAQEPDGPILVAYQRYGQGKALSLNAGGLWRWSFRETGQEESEAAYQRFWVSLLQWLLGGSQFLPGADVALTSARRYYTSEQPMRFLISTRNLDAAAYQPRLVISGPGPATELEPRAQGDSRVAEAGPFAPGTYRVTLKNNVGKPAELTQTIQVMSASVENKELSADPETMRKLAEVSGGAVVGGDDIPRMSEVVRRREARRELARREQPVWDRWWVCAALVGVLGLEWWLRRQEGLP
jgi:hypothetical protein